MTSEIIRLATEREWRELGFYYTLDEANRVWRIIGSKEGLLDFSRLLFRYCADERNEKISEHEHYGPYAYLEVGTWHEPEITDHWIAGTLESLGKLALATRRAAISMKPGDTESLRGEFAPQSSYDIVLELKAGDFDPARENREK